MKLANLAYAPLWHEHVHIPICGYTQRIRVMHTYKWQFEVVALSCAQMLQKLVAEAFSAK